MPESNTTNEALNILREKLRDMFHFSHNDLKLWYLPYSQNQTR